MEFSNATDDPCKRSRRVRSWYLYEQFKSLERSQLDAARQLKDKSYQERILRQELTERRARRRLCDQFGLCQSESKLGRSVNSKTLLTSSADDFYESFCRLHNDDVDMSSWDGSQSSKTYQECRLQYRDGIRNSDSVTSVLQNINQEDNLTDTVKEDLQIVQRDIVENINNQLETVRENIDYINEYTKMSDDEKLSDDSYNSVDECDKEKLADFVVLKESKCIFLTVLSAWSKLVEFSYRNMQINNWGNCYHDYGTQLLVAILACDMLRQGLNKMCYVLQPYVSPVKFAPSQEDLTETKKEVKDKQYRKPQTTSKLLPHVCKKKAIRAHYRSEYKCRPIDHRATEWKSRGMSEPRRSVARYNKSGESSSSLWPSDLKVPSSKSNCKCVKIKSVVNSMLQLSRHLDYVLREVRSVNYA